MAISKIGSNSVNLASGLDIADGDITLASGHGLSFAATADTSVSGASTGNELLDDYEEGTWTPIVAGSSSDPSYSTSVAAGKYTRIGNIVHIQWNIIITGVSSQGSGSYQVEGVPFTAVHNTYQGHIGIMYNDTFDEEIQKGFIPNGTQYIRLAPTGTTQTVRGFGTLSTGYFGGGGIFTAE